jgi:hemolysin-activating ACP:hemolysin acyltransferase
MQILPSCSAPPPAPAARPALRLFQPTNPAAALGLAVSHLMSKSAFAGLRFGAWSRVLAGQVNRGHYRLVVDPRDRVVGFLGWALTSETCAEAWLHGRGFDGEEAADGPCVVFNAWSADTPEVHRFVLETARRVVRGRRRVYARRVYRDGRSRPVSMSVNAFVAGHLERS